MPFLLKLLTILRLNGLRDSIQLLQVQLVSGVNRTPIDLNFTGSLAFNENLSIGTTLAEFNASDPDGDSLTYHLVDENGSTKNDLFTLDQNGTLKTAVLFDYETNASTYLIRIQAKDELNASIEKDFTLLLLDINNSAPVNLTFMTAINPMSSAQNM